MASTKYSDKLRKEALEAIKGGMSIPDVAKSLNIPKGTISTWRYFDRTGEYYSTTADKRKKADETREAKKAAREGKKAANIQTEMPQPELSSDQIQQAVIDLLVKGRKYDGVTRELNEAREKIHCLEKRNRDLNEKVMNSFTYKLGIADGTINPPIEQAK